MAARVRRHLRLSIIVVAIGLCLAAFTPTSGQATDKCDPSQQALKNLVKNIQTAAKLEDYRSSDLQNLEKYRQTHLIRPNNNTKALQSFRIAPDLKQTAQSSFDKLNDSARFVEWLLRLKKKMIDRTLAIIENPRNDLERSKTRYYRELLEYGNVDRAIYAEVLIEVARQNGWDTPRVLPKVEGKSTPVNETKEFLAFIANGDLFWDVPQRNKQHGQDSHILQFLYLSETINPDHLRELIRWISKNDSEVKSLWDIIFDESINKSLHRPENIKELAEQILPVE